MGINKVLLKQIVILSFAFGLVIGVLTLIPFVKELSFLFLIFGSAPLIFVFLKRKELVKELEDKLAMTYGGIIGFVSFLGFCVSFMPLVLIISSVFKTYYSYGIKYFFNFASFWLLILIILMLAITNALINAVCGWGCNYIYDLIKDNKGK